MLNRARALPTYSKSLYKMLLKHASIMRVLGKNTFAVCFDGCPGVHQIYAIGIDCAAVPSLGWDDERATRAGFYGLVKSLSIEKCLEEAGADNALPPYVPVTIELGMYELELTAWLGCVVYYPRLDDASSWRLSHARPGERRKGKEGERTGTDPCEEEAGFSC